MLKELARDVPPVQMKFTHSPFWIQVHDMPLLCMNKGVGTKIGESLGELEDVDVAGDGVRWGRCLRLRVNIDLHKPLERGRALNLGEKAYWVNFKYEKLPLLCFYCGRILHARRGCEKKPSQCQYDEDGVKEWGTWLRAEEPRRRYGGGGGGNSGEGGWDSEGEAAEKEGPYMEKSVTLGYLAKKGITGTERAINLWNLTIRRRSDLERSWQHPNPQSKLWFLGRKVKKGHISLQE